MIRTAIDDAVLLFWAAVIVAGLLIGGVRAAWRML